MQIPNITTCLEKYSFRKVLSLIIFVLRKNNFLQFYVFSKKRILAFHTKIFNRSVNVFLTLYLMVDMGNRKGESICVLSRKM